MNPVFGVVVPVGPDREENVTAVLRCLDEQTIEPRVIVLVGDGVDIDWPPVALATDLAILPLDKHRPGMPQPRNRGAALLAREYPEVTHVAFLDSDILVRPDWLAYYDVEIKIGGPEGCYIGPYEWLDPGMREIDTAFTNDHRWPLFEAHIPGTRHTEDLSVGLACYSGNLVWNLADFRRVGGFWSEIHHGRCEDGELGLRAVHMGVPIGLVPGARGWHMHHPRNMKWILDANRRDVPMLKERHPWVELGQGGNELFVVDEDGKRFNVRCQDCGWEGNTAFIWSHEEECPALSAP